MKEVLALLFAVVALVAFPDSAHATGPLDSWEWVHPKPQPNTLRGVTAGNGIFVAVGDSGTVSISANGVDWAPRYLPERHDLEAVTFFNGTFYATGTNGLILRSADGMNWSGVATGVANSLHCIAAGPDRLIAAGSDGVILVSTNGLQWTQANSEPGIELMGCAFGGGRFIAVGRGGVIRASSDGASWTAETAPTLRDLFAVTWGNGRFVAVGGLAPVLSGGNLITSTMEGVWEDHSPGWFYELHAVTFSGGLFHAFGLDHYYGQPHGSIIVSGNGIDWDRLYGKDFPTLMAAAAAGSIRVTVGTNGVVAHSDDGYGWFGSEVRRDRILFQLAAGGGRIIGIGNISTPITSTNGTDWQEIAPAMANSGLTHILFDDGRFFAGNALASGPSLSATSTNGVNWTLASTPAKIRRIAFGRGLLCGVGPVILQDNRYTVSLYFSQDGLTWTLGNNPQLGSSDASDVAFGNGVFVAATAGGFLLSTDATNWTQSADSLANMNPIRFADGRFVAQSTNLLMLSTNGTNWSSLPFAAPTSTASPAFGNGTWFLGGTNGVLYSSENLTNWTTHLLPTHGTVNDILFYEGHIVVATDSGLLRSAPLRWPEMRTGSMVSGGFRVGVTGEIGAKYRILSSTNLVNWTEQGSLTNSLATDYFLDVTAPQFPRRFYRAVNP